MASKATSRPVILIVEDEPLIRMSLMALIEEAGFEPVAAAHADEAIGILQWRSDVRVLVTDIQMPGPMDGIALLRTVRQRWPNVELILTSGLIGGLPDQELPARARFVPKPIEAERLLSAIQVLSAGASVTTGESQRP